MSTINIESGGKLIPIAKVGIIDSQEKILLGSLERDLVLQTLGNISIQAGNMFYKLSFDSSGNISTTSNNMIELQSLDNFSISSYSDGTFIFDLSTESLYLVYNKDLIPIAGASASDHIYLSFINEQTLTGEQKQRLVLNSGSYVKSLNNVAYFSRADVYENQIIFVEDEKQHYILTDINNPNGKSAWTTFYIGMNGGIIYNGLTIQNTNRENLLYLNGVDDFIPGRFNGLKIGDSEKSLKVSVNSKNQTVIDSNTESLIIKTSKADVLYYHDGNLGIYGEPATSDKYKIAINGTTKFNDSVFLERRFTSTDFITTNITHWDGGQGFGLIKTVNNRWFFECDGMVVRGSLVANKLKLKELEVERAYATGGHMIITDGADVDSVYYRLPTAEELETANVTNNGNYGSLDANTYYYFITFKDSTEKDDNNAYVALDTTPNATTSTSGEGSSIEEDTLDAENYCPFINGDVLLCQTASGKSAKKYYCLVTYSTNKYAVIKADDFRNNQILQYDEQGEVIGVDYSFLVESGDSLIRITNIIQHNGIYEYKNRRRFIDIDGTRNQITMYDNLGDPNLFLSQPNENGVYEDINIITGIGLNGSLRLRIGELSDLGISGLTGYGLYGDNVYLKGRLIVKTDDYEEMIGANRGVWLIDNTNKYYVNDLVSYDGSVYRCTVEHANSESNNIIPGVADYWEIWVAKGELSGYEWIDDWDSNSTVIDSQYIISPRIFTGTITNGHPTGIIIGRNAFNYSEIGIAGYNDGLTTFHLNAVDGSFSFGNGNNSISYNPSTNLITIGSDVTMKWSNITDTNTVTDKLTYIDANGIYTGTLSADNINAGTLNVDRIAANSLTANHIQTSTITTLGNITAGSFNLGNGKFVVDANGNLTSTNANIVGKITANRGKIGGFTIDENGLTNAPFDGRSEAYIIFRDDPSKIFAGIGTSVFSGVTGVVGVARFENHATDNFWYSGTNFSLYTSARGAATNCAISIGGGYVEGFALKPDVVGLNKITSATRPTSMTYVIPRTINAIYASCQFYWRSSSANSFEAYTRDVYLNFPDMQQYDNGHVLKIKRGTNSGSHLYLSPGSYTYQEYVSGSLVERTGPTAILSTGSTYNYRTDPLDVESEGDAMEFVFFGDLSTTYNGTTYRGIWVQWKNPRRW